MSEKLSYYEGTTASGVIVKYDSNGINGLAQPFTLSENANIDYVILMMSNNPGAGASTCTVAIYTDGGGEPGSSLGNKTFSSNELAATKAVKAVVFDSAIELTAGDYYIVVTDSVSNQVRWWIGAAGAGPQGALEYDDGVWETFNSPDRTFYYQVWGGSAAPSKPTDPDPADDAEDVDFSDLTLSWTDGGGADTFAVYVGDAADNLTEVSSSQIVSYKILSIAERALFTNHCYWRVDATNDEGTTTGDVWDFVVAGPGKAWNPQPADDAEDVRIVGIDKLKTLQWAAPS